MFLHIDLFLGGMLVLTCYQTVAEETCSDSETFRIKAQVSCEELADLDRITVKKICKKNKGNVRRECCQVCGGAGFPPPEEHTCQVTRLLHCPDGITPSGKCSPASLNMTYVGHPDLNLDTVPVNAGMSQSFRIILLDKSIQNFSGNMCIMAEFKPLTGVHVEMVIAEFGELENYDDANWLPIRELESNVEQRSELPLEPTLLEWGKLNIPNLPDFPFQLEYAGKSAGNTVFLDLNFDGWPTVPKVTNTKLLSLHLYSCLCSEQPSNEEGRF